MNNKKPLITIACSYDTDYFLDALKNLSNEKIIDLKYWVGVKGQIKKVHTFFSGVFTHNIIDAIKGVGIEVPELEFPPLDKDYIQQFFKCQFQALEMMNRLDPSNLISFNERTSLYYEMLQYWSGIVDKIKPDLILFTEAPHGVFDFILYEIAKFRGIKIRGFGTFELGDAYFFITSGYDVECSNNILKEYKKYLKLNKNDELLDKTINYINKIRNRAYLDAVPFYFTDLLKKEPKRFKWIPKYIRKILLRVRQFYYLILRAKQHAPPNYLKSKNATIQNSHYSGIQFLFHKYKSNKYKRKLSKYYEKFCTTPDFSKPYIYLALHYQPEMSSSPSGGVYSHQYLIIDLLSKLVPKDWKVYVKEHPWQFSKTSKGEQDYNRGIMYKKASLLPNVELIKIKEDPFKIIKKAKAVATITGKVGLEAVIQNVPVLIFGTAYYFGCEGVFKIGSKNDLLKTLKLIEEGYKVDTKKVEIYFKTIEEKCCLGYIDPVFSKISSINDIQNAENIALAIRGSLYKS